MLFAILFVIGFLVVLGKIAFTLGSALAYFIFWIILIGIILALL